MSDQEEAAGLVTKQTSPAVIKKTFTRVGKLLDILASDMAKPLPPKAKFEKLDEEGFRDLANKLTRTATKYVLFVCQEGTMKTVETETTGLLEVLRVMCTSLRALLPTASATLKSMIVDIGSTIFNEFKTLLNDLSEQVAVQWKEMVNGTPTDGLDALDTNKSLVRITARIWGTCERLANIPTTNAAAVALKVQEQFEMIADARRELSELTEGEREFPAAESDDDEDMEDEDEDCEDEDDLACGLGKLKLSAEEAELMALEKELNMMTTLTAVDHKKPTKTQNQIDQEDLEFNEKELAKSEFKWIAPALALTDTTASIMEHVAGLLPRIQPPSVSGELNIAADPKAAIEEKKQLALFNEEVERRRTDCEYICDHIDKLANALYTPQSIPSAARSSYIITSRMAKILVWLDRYYRIGWMDAHIAAQGGKTSKDTTIPEEPTVEADSSSSSSAKKPWFQSRLINSTLPAEVKGRRVEIEGEEEDEPVVLTVEQRKRKEEFDQSHPITSMSPWGWINKMRETLYDAALVSPSLVEMHMTFRTGEELVDDSDDDDDDGGNYADEDDDYYDEFDDDNIIYY